MGNCLGDEIEITHLIELCLVVAVRVAHPALALQEEHAIQR